MPIYSFKCSKCNKEFEAIVKVDARFTNCGVCDYIAVRVGDIEGGNIIKFKEPGGVYNPGFGDRKYE